MHVSLLCRSALLFLAALLLAGSATAEKSLAPEPPLGEKSAGAGWYTKYDERVTPLLERMTLAEKIGQMTQADLEHVRDKKEVINELMLGSVLSGGNADPLAGNSQQAWTDTYNACQQQALDTRLGIPILYGVDAVHGHSNVIGAVIFPHNIGLGCADDAELMEEIGRLTALEVRATGIQWTFAPCVTAPQDDRWGRTYEGFSEDPVRISRLGGAQVRGLQGKLGDPTRVLACAKHFVGDGGTTAVNRDSAHEGFDVGMRIRLDQGDTRVDFATLRRVHVSPYLPCLAEGVGTIMPSYSSWNGVKCSASKELLTDLLKEELGFEGFLISDYNAIDQCHPDFKTAVGISINAGMDMAMSPQRFPEFIEKLTELVEEGVVPMSRIDDAVRRILRVKAAMGLLDPDRDQLADPAAQAYFGTPEHRLVGREAVRKSLVLLKNDDGVLPLKQDAKRLHVAGVAADDLGIQCGGWTIHWQGGAGDITEGTTILEGLREVAAGVEVTHSDDGAGAEGADAAIVVVGEKPYAEGVGDNQWLTLSDEDQALIDRVASSGTPMVLVVVSGRPLILGDALEKADAVVAAWLPGSEGQGVADVLLGHHAPTGTLSFTWPRTADQHPINVGDEDYDPLFEYGYGLTY